MMVSSLEAWRIKVKGRDVVCVDCGVEENLHAHHIKPRSEFPDLILDVENGVCVCRECHAKRHKDTPGIVSLILTGKGKGHVKRNDNEFARMLKRLGWSQQYFADLVGISVNTVHSWCKNESGGSGYKIAVWALEMIAKVLGV